MKLTSLLSDIGERVPNAFSENVLVGWINRATDEVYKILSEREGFVFTAPGGQSVFPLPRDISCALISAVTVNGKSLTARRIDDVVGQDIWYKITDGFMGIYPAPQKGQKICLYYFAKPKPFLTREEAAEEGTDFASQVLKLDGDFKELITLGTLITVCEAREDTALANNYKISYNLLLARARQERFEKDGKYPVTKMIQK